MHVRPALARDLPDLATVSKNAMFDDEIRQVMAPHRHEHPGCLRNLMLRRAKMRLYDSHLVLAGISDENDPWWDGEEKVVAYLSAWSTLKKKEDAAKPWFSWNALELHLLHLEELLEWYTFADRSISRAVWREYLESVSRGGLLPDIKQYWEIDHVSVNPDYQGNGIGKIMMKEIQKVAQKDNLPIVLIATKSGRFLYQKVGFVDKGPFHAAGLTLDTMVWYPPNSSQSEETTNHGNEKST